MIILYVGCAYRIAKQMRKYVL